MNLLHRSWLVTGALAVVGLTPGVAQERELLSEEPAVILDLEGESLIEATRIKGTISIRVGRPGELRYMARSLDNRREERPVALWLEGRKLVFEPIAGQEDEALMLEIAASPELGAAVEMRDGNLSVGGLEGGVTVQGQSLDFHTVGLLGSAELVFEDSKVRIENCGADVDLQAQGSVVRLKGVAGFASVGLLDSEGDISDTGDLELELENARVSVGGVRGELRVNASGGELSVTGVNRGAQLDLDETPLLLEQTKGEVEVRTNADVQFRELDSHLRVESYGGSVRGSGSTGAVEVRTDGAEVVMEKIGGVTIVEGDELRIRLSDLQSDAIVRTTASTVVVERVDGGLTVRNDFGEVAVSGIQKKVQIENRDGNVRASNLRGPLTLVAESEEVRVGWVQMAAEGDSKIENERGDVWIAFPRTAGCRVEAEARYGTVDSNLRDIQVTDDGRTASGVLGRRNRPAIQIKSGRDVYLREAVQAKPRVNTEGG